MVRIMNKNKKTFVEVEGKEIQVETGSELIPVAGKLYVVSNTKILEVAGSDLRLIEDTSLCDLILETVNLQKQNREYEKKVAELQTQSVPEDSVVNEEPSETEEPEDDQVKPGSRYSLVTPSVLPILSAGIAQFAELTQRFVESTQRNLSEPISVSE